MDKQITNKALNSVHTTPARYQPSGTKWSRRQPSSTRRTKPTGTEWSRRNRPAQGGQNRPAQSGKALTVQHKADKIVRHRVARQQSSSTRRTKPSSTKWQAKPSSTRRSNRPAARWSKTVQLKAASRPSGGQGRSVQVAAVDVHQHGVSTKEEEDTVQHPVAESANATTGKNHVL